MTVTTLHRAEGDEPAPSSRSALVERYRGRLFLKVAEVAELVDTDARTVRRGIELEQIPAVHIGTTIRVPAAPFWALCGLDPQTLEALADEEAPRPQD